MTGFERLVEYLFGWIRYLRFWMVIQQYERGCLYRLGLAKRELGPGFHWIIPFGIDEVVTDNVVTGTKMVECRTPTQDGREIAARATLVWTITDIMKFLNEVEDADAAIIDISGPAMRKVLASKTWDEIVTSPPEGLDQEITTAVRARQPGRWGIGIRDLALEEIGRVRTIRLIQD